MPFHAVSLIYMLLRPWCVLLTEAAEGAYNSFCAAERCPCPSLGLWVQPSMPHFCRSVAVGQYSPDRLLHGLLHGVTSKAGGVVQA